LSGKIGFVSLGCPKALVDAERIVTQLRAEGYEIGKDYAGSDLVVVNTCGFIDSAVQESLDAIGEALAENGRVIVTGCLGAKKNADGSDSRWRWGLERVKTDIDKLYIAINEDKDFGVAQVYVFGKLLRTFEEFTKPETAK
jgi:tRNA A37 methylthiotransferase MiaB